MNFAFCRLSPPPVSKTFSWNRSLDREYVWQHHSGTYCMNTLELTVKADHLIRPVFHILGKGKGKYHFGCTFRKVQGIVGGDICVYLKVWLPVERMS